MHDLSDSINHACPLCRAVPFAALSPLPRCPLCRVFVGSALLTSRFASDRYIRSARFGPNAKFFRGCYVAAPLAIFLKPSLFQFQELFAKRRRLLDLVLGDQTQ